MDKKEIKKRMRELGIQPQKSLGQNFLINPVLSQRIIESVKELKPQHIVEIGPGLGGLTEHLILLNKPLHLIELDKIIFNYWKNRKLNITYGNVLKLLSKSFFQKECLVIGNLPFHIASQLVIKMSLESHGSKVKNMVLMVQKEVGERILSLSHKKTFGVLSVVSQCFWDCRFMFEAQISDFYPSPKIKAWVLLFKRKAKPKVKESSFFDFLKECFSQKRKILSTKLKKKYNHNILSVFDNIGISHLSRAEEIKPQQFIDLYQILYK